MNIPKLAVLLALATSLPVAWAIEDLPDPVAVENENPEIYTQKLSNQKPGNFGKTVSEATRQYRETPFPGYRNFGEWVSSQRKHRKTGPPPPPPNDGGDPTKNPPAPPSVKDKGHPKPPPTTPDSTMGT